MFEIAPKDFSYTTNKEAFTWEQMKHIKAGEEHLRTVHPVALTNIAIKARKLGYTDLALFCEDLVEQREKEKSRDFRISAEDSSYTTNPEAFTFQQITAIRKGKEALKRSSKARLLNIIEKAHKMGYEDLALFCEQVLEDRENEITIHFGIRKKDLEYVTNPNGFTYDQVKNIKLGREHMEGLHTNALQSIMKRSIELGYKELTNFCKDVLKERSKEKARRDKELANRTNIERFTKPEATSAKVGGPKAYTPRQKAIIRGDIGYAQATAGDYTRIFHKAVKNKQYALAEQMTDLIRSKDLDYRAQETISLKARHLREYSPDSELPRYIQKIIEGKVDISHYSKSGRDKIRLILRNHGYDTQFITDYNEMPKKPTSKSSTSKQAPSISEEEAMKILNDASLFGIVDTYRAIQEIGNDNQ